MKEIISYPKVNISLIVKKINNNNLHKIKSVFLINKSIYDSVFISEWTNDDICYFDTNNKKINVDNCIIKRTLSFLKKNFNIKNNYKVKIIKRIPIGSGLGGASSNAASVIKYILNNEKINYKDIYKNIHKLGSDIAFFLKGFDSAIVKGYGNIIRKFNIKNFKYKLVINEDINCSTKLVYEEFDKSKKNKKKIFILQLLYINLKWYNKLWNDLEEPCLSIYNNLKEKMNKENNKVILSGSGSSYLVFKKGE